MKTQSIINKSNRSLKTNININLRYDEEFTISKNVKQETKKNKATISNAEKANTVVLFNLDEYIQKRYEFINKNKIKY